MGLQDEFWPLLSIIETSVMNGPDGQELQQVLAAIEQKAAYYLDILSR
jgi:hypothetical protein